VAVATAAATVMTPLTKMVQQTQAAVAAELEILQVVPVMVDRELLLFDILLQQPQLLQLDKVV
jgi:hypothetical protein